MDRIAIAWTGIRIVLALAVVAGMPWPPEASASPARRMARRGAVVVPAPAPVIVGPRGRVRAMPWVAVPVPAAGPGLAAPVPPPVTAASPAVPAGSLAVPAGSLAVPAVPPPPRTLSSSAPVGPAIPQPVPAMPPSAPTPATAMPPAGIEEILPPPAAGPVQPAEAGPALAASAPDPTAAFTPPWYASHPGAWRPPQPLDAWATPEAARLDAWLDQPVRTAAGAAPDGTAVTAAGAVAPDGTRSVLVLPAGHDDGAAALLPLGVFAPIAPGDSGSHSRQLLTVDRQARIKGTFYDALSDSVGPISGSIDRESRKASWTIGASGSRFEAPLEAFTNPARTVAVTAGGVTTRGWLLMPVSKP